MTIKFEFQIKMNIYIYISIVTFQIPHGLYVPNLTWGILLLNLLHLATQV